MSTADTSLRRRVEAAESRLAAAESSIFQAMQFAQERWVWPRDMFLGRTYASSIYPATGDTFQVQLLEGDFPATDGVTAVNEVLRGTVVYARTWPAKYLAQGTQVIVKRIRGLGAEGRGEYWIEPSGSGTDPVVQYGSADTGKFYGLYPSTNVITIAVGATPALMVHPSFGASLGIATNRYIQTTTPVNGADPWGVVVKSGRYLFHIQTTWALKDLTASQNAFWYPAGERFGPYAIECQTMIFTNTWNITALSRGIVKSSGVPSSATTESTMMHDIHTVRSFAVGEEVRLAIGMSTIESPYGGSVSAYLPTARLVNCRAAALYCGDGTNV